MSHKTIVGFNNVITRPSVPYHQSEGQMVPKKFAAKNLSPRFTRSMKVSQGKRFLDKESYSPSSSTLHSRNNVSMDSHNRRLCFNYNLGRCNEAAHGAQCSKGFHLCMRKDCHAPHPECEHDKS